MRRRGSADGNADGLEGNMGWAGRNRDMGYGCTGYGIVAGNRTVWG